MWCESYAIFQTRQGVDRHGVTDTMPFCERTLGHDMPHRGEGWVWDDDSIYKEDSSVAQAQHPASTEQE